MVRSVVREFSFDQPSNSQVETLVILGVGIGVREIEQPCFPSPILFVGPITFILPDDVNGPYQEDDTGKLSKCPKIKLHSDNPQALGHIGEAKHYQNRLDKLSNRGHTTPPWLGRV